MKTITVNVEVFEEDDYVLTPCGVGIVVKAEDEIINNIWQRRNYVVRHSRGYSNNPSNSPVEMDVDALCSITKEEYEKK